jgi:hypothetical protein
MHFRDTYILKLHRTQNKGLRQSVGKKKTLVAGLKGPDAKTN